MDRQQINHFPLKGEWQLIIAGAGPAGCAAALRAGRAGIKTLLIEAATQPGGMGTSGMVSSFAPMSDGNRCVAGGIALELVEELYSRGAMGAQVTREFWETAVQRWIPFQPEELAYLYDQLLAEAGVTVLYAARLVDVLREDMEVTEVLVADVEGLYRVRASYFIDATGDAALTNFAGFPVEEAGRDTPNIMPPTLCALFSSINWEHMKMSPSGNCPFRQQEMLEQAISENQFSSKDKHLPGLYRIGPGMGMMNAGHLFKTNAVHSLSLSSCYSKGRELIREYLNFYKRYIPGCEDMQLVTTAPLLGVRESRRIIGEYILTYQDYVNKPQFPDTIGRCSGSVDIHVYDDTEAEYERYHREFNMLDKQGLGDSFAIPYGSLVPKGAKNLLVAGRCVSTDIKVQGALRIQPAAAVMGEAAGAAVILASRSGKEVLSVDKKELQSELKAGGAVLE